ncbi:hypothetical protein [Larkinella arboricola]
MLDLLETIAGSLGLTFCYGEVSDLNIEADKLASPSAILLFHEGYTGGPLETDQEQNTYPVYDLRLWILMRSDLADVPLTHRSRLDTLQTVMFQIINRIQEREEVAQVTNLRFVEGVKMRATDNPLDGIRLYGSVQIDLDTRCL